MPRAVAARKTAIGGRGALVVVAGGRSIGCTLHGTRRAPRPHLRVPRAPRHSHRSQGAQGSPQEGSQVPRAGLRRERVEPREEEEPQVSVTRVVGVEGE